MTRTLFSIGADLLALNELIDDLDGDISDPQVEAAYVAFVTELATDEGRKLDGYVGWIKQLEMESVAAKAEAEQWSKRAQVRDNRVKWLKERIKAYLEGQGRSKATTETGRALVIQANGGVRSIAWADPIDLSKLPAEFTRTRIEIDKDAVRKCLEADEPLAFARLEARGFRLRIK
jgi:hypothetical protein